MTSFKERIDATRARAGLAANAAVLIDDTSVNEIEGDEQPDGAEGEAETSESADSGDDADVDIDSVDGAGVGGASDEGFEPFDESFERLAANEDVDVTCVVHSHDSEPTDGAPRTDDEEGGKDAADFGLAAAMSDNPAIEKVTEGQDEAAATSNPTSSVAATTAVAHEIGDTAAANADLATAEVSTSEAHTISADKPVATDVPTATGRTRSFHGGDLFTLRARATRNTKVMTLEIAAIRRDVPMRAIQQDTVKDYAELHEAGTKFPRPKAFEEVDSVTGASIFRLVDGQHRLAAYRSLGLTHVEVDVQQGNLWEAKLATAASNIYGLPLTNQQKRDVAALMFEECPDWTPNSIATWTGMSPTFIGKELVKYEAAHGIAPDPDRIRVSTSGKQYKARVRNQPPTVDPAAQAPTVLREPPRRISDGGQTVSLPSDQLAPERGEDNEDSSDEPKVWSVASQATIAAVPQSAPTGLAELSVPIAEAVQVTLVAPAQQEADGDGEQPKLVVAAIASRFTIRYLDASGAQREAVYDFDRPDDGVPSALVSLESLIRNVRKLRENQVPAETLLGICQRAMQG